MSINTMKLALEALEVGWSPKYVNGVDAREKGMEAITALRQAIEQAQKQEPVVWIDRHELSAISEDVSPTVGNRKLSEHDVPLYTSPPQRQPLTDEQIEDITADIHGLPIHVDDYTFARAIEAAHGIGEQK